MKTPMLPRYCFYLPALLLTATDAWAWGLYTHVWFAQALLWLVPLADPRFREAAQKLPKLVLAGACLPDLALMGGLVRSQKMETSHDWALAARLLERAGSDEERALALGFASHLLSDIFAHNYFVPAHEHIWGDIPVVTHAASEWALDHHVREQIFSTPGELLHGQITAIVPYLQSMFACDATEARRFVVSLARADRLLRFSQLPTLAHGIGRLGDSRMVKRFNHYLSETAQRLPQINALIAGEQPQWHANPPKHLAHTSLTGQTLKTLHICPMLPRDVFATLARRHDSLRGEFFK